MPWTIKQHIDAGHYPVQGQVTLRDGRTAMIYTTDHPDDNRPIVGATMPHTGASTNRWSIYSWRADGKHVSTASSAPDQESLADILPPPPRTVELVYWTILGRMWAPERPVVYSTEEACDSFLHQALDTSLIKVRMTGTIETPWPEDTGDADTLVEETPIATTQFVDVGISEDADGTSVVRARLRDDGNVEILDDPTPF